MTDLHRHTVYHDAAFHAFMDSIALTPLAAPGMRNWRSWGFRRIRMYAKQWNFSKAYGMDREALQRAILGTGQPAMWGVNWWKDMTASDQKKIRELYTDAHVVDEWPDNDPT